MPEETRSPAKHRTPETETGVHRAQAIVASLRAGAPSSAEVYEAFWQLDALPAEDVRDALASWVGPLPDLDRLDTATRLALGLPLRALRLRTLSVEKDADILDLGPIAEEQLRLAGKSWDGADLAPEERLDGELEGSFAGTLERRVLANADAEGETPLFDVLLFGEDSGVVFAAGTSKVIALIAYGKVEMRDRRTRVALEEAVAAREASAPEASAPETSAIETTLPSESTAVTSEEPTAVSRAKKLAKKPAKKTATKTAKTAATKTAKTAATKTAKTAATKTAKTAATKTAKTAATKTAKKTAAATKAATTKAKPATARTKKTR